MQRARSKLFDDGAMLLMEAPLQSLFRGRIQRQQVKVIVRPAVQHASVEIDGGINQRVGDAAIFRWDVIRRASRLDVRIVTKKHWPVRSELRAGLSLPRSYLSSAFDRLAFESLL